ncbi:uncharacterized protein RCC_06756 [Ramularia collo-cygni]|uniref:Uncharacterized protein n=1 Tax=Ramularia collo-cygni TaxID=112498 RepID=A0A2D3VB33_9PEZI|nr:uncharacterized protein RCC_06756 [Ramularia collo-cygni]CZT20896.1 uncharacterized protein RCC_06756 [Ramularia collo-cygni]
MGSEDESTPNVPPSDDQGSSKPAETHFPITRPNGLPPLYVDLSGLSWETESRRAAVVRSIGQSMQTSSDKAVQVLGRPYKQEELDACAFHFIKARKNFLDYGSVGLGIAFALSWLGRHTFRFPFYAPKWTYFSPDRFLFFRGRIARAHWHAMRTSAYLMLGIYSSAYASMVVAVSGQRRDPRLKDYLTVESQMNIRDILQPLIQDGSAERKTEVTSEIARQWPLHQRLDGRHRDGPGDEGENSMAEHLDGNPPTEGPLVEDYQDQYQQTDKRALLEAIRRADGKNVDGEHGDQWGTSQSHQNASSSPIPSPLDRKVSTSSSPVASGSQPSESAWDRLRQQAERQASQLDEVADSGDAFDDRSEAQRKFDAQIEQERKFSTINKDGSNGSGGS